MKSKRLDRIESKLDEVIRYLKPPERKLDPNVLQRTEDDKMKGNKARKQDYCECGKLKPMILVKCYICLKKDGVY